MIVRTRPLRRSPSPRPSWLACEAVPGRVMQIQDGTLSMKEMIDVLLRDDGWLEAAAVFPEKEAGSVGRSRKYPSFVWTLWSELRDIFESHWGVERELGRGQWWKYIRKELRRLRPGLPQLPRRPPRRQNFEYWRDRYLATDEGISRLSEIHTQVATRKAKEAGNLDPEGRGSFTHPEFTRTVYGDGKVVTPLYRAKPGTTTVNRRTGEAREVRSDPDARWHTEGGGDKVWGNKVAIVSNRRSEGRFILAIERVEKDKDEPKAAIAMLRRVIARAPGAQAVVWDMILRGDHIQTILTEIGILPVVGVHAKKNPEGKKGRSKGTYVPKALDLEDIEVSSRDGPDRIAHIAAHDGWASVKELTETGEPHYERMDCRRIQRHEDKRRFRWYGSYRLPDEYGSRVISLRLHQSEDDDRRPINRTENLRGIPEGSADFARLQVLRPDAESINRGIEDSLYIQRATGKGWRRQMVDLLGHARLVNAITLARCRARERLQASA